MNVLVIEDDAVSRGILLAQMKKLGHTVSEAENGAQGWSLYNDGDYPLVITDWMMPDMDGLELCRRIRAANRAKYTYVIILTGRDRRGGVFEGMNAGADDFVTKPCDAVEMSLRVRVAERIVSLQQEVEQLEGLLPICPTCKRIQGTDGVWEIMESYVTKRTDAQFSHGVCPSCYETIMKPQIENLKRQQKR
jgi:sigma-B regulation protein RsbU (phosphoserine phosphatase)